MMKIRKIINCGIRFCVLLGLLSVAIVSPPAPLKSRVLASSTLCNLSASLEANDVNLIRWSPQGHYLLSTQREAATLLLWDLASGKTVKTFSLPNEPVPSAVAWSPNEDRIATLEPSYTIRIWDVRDSTVVSSYNIFEQVSQEVNYITLPSLAWHPKEDKLAVVHDFNISLLNIHTGELQTTNYRRQEGYGLFGAVQVLWIKNGEQLAVANTDGTVYFLDSNTLEIIQSTHNDSYYQLSPISKSYSMTFNSTETFVALAGWSFLRGQAAVILYDLENLQAPHLLEDQPMMITSLAWGHNDLLAIGGEGFSITEVDPTSLSNEIKCSYSGTVSSLSWHPSENLLAVAGQDGKINIWRIA